MSAKPEFPKTVARNSKRVDAIFAAATNCNAWSLANGFRGTETSAAWIREQFDNGGKLIDNGAGAFQVNIHSNLWFTFNAPGV